MKDEEMARGQSGNDEVAQIVRAGTGGGSRAVDTEKLERFCKVFIHRLNAVGC
jgi:hypothetical protein